MNPLTEQLAEAHNIVTDALGFELKVCVEIGQYEFRGEHRTRESSETGKVAADALHTIRLSSSIAQDEIPEVIAHECYHLFYSVRHLITVDEETEAEVFGQLCKRVNAILASVDAAKANGGWLPIESAPRDGTLFLCWVSAERRSQVDGGGSCMSADTSEVDFCQWRDNNGNGYFMNMLGQIGDMQDITHWMPLPPPPEQTK